MSLVFPASLADTDLFLEFSDPVLLAYVLVNKLIEFPRDLIEFVNLLGQLLKDQPIVSILVRYQTELLCKHGQGGVELLELVFEFADFYGGVVIDCLLLLFPEGGLWGFGGGEGWGDI
jgi:hypothetical protein